MSRTGLYPSDVRKARDSLLAQGRHPSVDAVRVALGNTGSKTTIHKYLKEFEAKEGVVNGRSVAVSDALQDLVARLAARLHEEADLRADAALVDSTEEARRQAQNAQKLQQDLEAARRCERDLTESLATERDMHEETKAALQRETILRHTAEQQAAGLKDRLIENEQHRASLEDKHAHARSALEHYRQSAKEQRDQEQRRHEQQLQQVQAELRLQQQALVAKQEEGGAT
ncbi:DNA-binding protein [Janthinobacterium sp. GB4P2]|uniref:DNA-binding protein n=1 Tax=Janthinobacterium sp. GB4P2 TaxID=3424189 RepID=UPI003F265CE8